jgi:hypothetical protein
MKVPARANTRGRTRSSCLVTNFDTPSIDCNWPDRFVRYSNDSACSWHVSYLCSQTLLSRTLIYATRTSLPSIIPVLHHLRPSLFPRRYRSWYTEKFYKEYEFLLLDSAARHEKTDYKVGSPIWNKLHAIKNTSIFKFRKLNFSYTLHITLMDLNGYFPPQMQKTI